MPYINNTEKVEKKLPHLCKKPDIRKPGYYGLRNRDITVEQGTIWECDECHKYYRAKKRQYYSQNPWIRIEAWNFLWYAKIIKHELKQWREKKNGEQ